MATRQGGNTDEVEIRHLGESDPCHLVGPLATGYRAAAPCARFA
jgi:hypothetical protein